jgi:multiple sugar transport system substrate-binding protein
VQAAFDAVYDPVAWYTGAGSDFQNAVGAVVAEVLGGAVTPQQGVEEMTRALKTFSTARPPV